MKHTRARLFSNDLEAVFTGRPNRFLITARDSSGRELSCHCPNPGRLIEFFGFRGYDIPGIRLILEKRKTAGTGAKTGTKTAKTGATVVGLYYPDRKTRRSVVVPLFSSRANGAAELLLLKEIIPDLTAVRAEYTLGKSRFDFLCTDAGGRRHLVEVKACSLVEYGSAMFPDAPSGRALKHLEELAELAGEGYVCHVLFVILHGAPKVFIPNLHTDPLLASGLSRLGTAVCRAKPGQTKTGAPGDANPGPAKPVRIHAALLRADPEGRASLAAASIPVDLSHGGLAAGDGGNYLIVLELAEGAETEVGSLGSLRFKRGWYVYTGSARKNLTRRISRHLRKIRKKKHWHLDYLTPFAAAVKALPIRSYRSLECDLSRELSALGGKPVRGRNGAGFGSSDCKQGCPAHLYYFAECPLRNRDFIALLLRYRHVEAFRK